MKLWKRLLIVSSWVPHKIINSWGKKENMKTCTKCNKEKELSEFYSQNKKNKDGLDYIYYDPACKECRTKNSWKRIKDNWEEYKAYHLSHYHEGKWAYAQKQNSINRRENGEYSKWQKESKEKLKVYAEKRKSKKHKISNVEWENCKKYFDYQCAYCGISLENQRLKFGKDFHKEHVENDGKNDLSNCIPSCTSCNTSKNVSALEDWYNSGNPNFSENRYDKIILWLLDDCFLYISEH